MKKKKSIKSIPKKIPSKTFQIIDPIFRQRIYILLNQDEKSYAKFLTRQKIKNVEKETIEINRFRGMSSWIEEKETGIRYYIILLKEFNWTLSHQNTLIHEIVHTIIKIWASNNIHFNEETQEFLAHSIGNLYEQIGRKLLTKKS